MIQTNYEDRKTVYDLIPYTEEALDIHIHKWHGALTPGIKLQYTNNSPFTSYTTLTPLPVSQAIWHPRKYGIPVQFFLGKMVPLQEMWNPLPSQEMLYPGHKIS